MPDPLSLTTLSTSALTTAVAEGSKILTGKMLAELIPRLSGRIKSVFQNTSANFDVYIRGTFERCTKIKTLINKSHPVDLLSIYVNSRFECGGQKIDDYEMVESVETVKRIVISGTGGGGKTIFMKYLWVSLLVNSRGKIPVFVELRRLNEMSVDDLLGFIYHSIAEIRSGIGRDQFDIALEEGAFNLILDGFDELTKDRKDSIERQVLALGRAYPKANIIVSSRPNDRFDAWQSFHVYKILPLDVKQVCDLIEKLDYDRILKRRFVSKITSELYAKHKSFLSNPLLATMMMLTFDQIAEIPSKMFLFYEQAFDTLFFKHDATKEGYKRERQTDLTIDEFKRFLSFFCLLSYHDEKSEFTDSDMTAYCQKMLKICGKNIDIDNFVGDVTESICVMQKEGMLYNYTHRSFQEYFAAFCLSNHIDNQLPEIVDHFLIRLNDNVVAMLFEMNQGRLEKEFILPNLKQIAAELSSLMPTFNIETYCKYLQIRVIALKHDRSYGVAISSEGREAIFVDSLARLYPEAFKPRKLKIDKMHKKDSSAVRRIMLATGVKRARQVSFTVGRESSSGSQDDEPMISAHVSSLADSGVSEYLQITWDIVRKLERDVRKRQEQKAKSLVELLGLKTN